MMSHIFKFSAITLIAGIIFSGCSTMLPVDRKVGQLNLKNLDLKQSPQVKHVISIVSPKISTQSKNENSSQPTNPLQAMLMQNMMSRSPMFDFSQAFSNSYSNRLDRALNTSVSEIISSKGFKLKGPYVYMDDMTYKDKKVVYLAFKPDIDFTISNKVLNTEHHRLYSHSEGVVQIGGSFTISMIEPMTGQVFIKRRINLDDFNIEERYIYEKQTTAGNGDFSLGGAVSAGIDKASAPEKLIDTTDVALTNAINKFYSSSISKINQYLDKEEILTFEEDILKLKGLKRF